MKRILILCLLLFFEGLVRATDISWSVPEYQINLTHTTNRDRIYTPRLNISFNYTSGEIEDFCFWTDPISSYCYNWLGNEKNTPSYVPIAPTYWCEEYECQGGGTGTHAYTYPQTTHNTNSTLGKNNEVCTLQTLNHIFAKYTCQGKDTAGTHRTNMSIDIYPTYYRFNITNITGVTQYIRPLISGRLEWINDSDTIRYPPDSDYGATSRIFDAPDWGGDHVVATENPVWIRLGAGVGGTIPKGYRPYAIGYENSYMGLGWDNRTPSDLRGLMWESVDHGTLLIQDTSYGLPSLCVPYASGVETKLFWIDYVYTGGYPEYGPLYTDEKLSKYYTAIFKPQTTLSRCGDFTGKTSIRKIWTSYSPASFEFSGTAYNRSFYYSDGTEVAIATDHDSMVDYGFEGSGYYGNSVKIQTDPILDQWKNRTWTLRLVYNLTPTTTTIYPNMTNYSFNLSGAYCGGNCTYANTKKWRLVNDMQEEIDFVVRGYGSTAMVYFQGTQLFKNNQTSYFLYITPNATVSDRAYIAGDYSPSVQNFTFWRDETFIENTSVTAIVPSSVYYKDSFEAKGKYFCEANPPWGQCTPGSEITDGYCEFVTLTDSYPLTYSDGYYRKTFSAGETTETIVWSIACSKTGYETAGDSGFLYIIAPCGWGGDAITSLECSTSGVKGFFVNVSGGLVLLIIALFGFSIIVSMFKIIEAL
jgi:hypothetical protein